MHSPNVARTGTYVACLDCGKEFPYDWGEMRIGKAVSRPLPASEGPAQVSLTANASSVFLRPALAKSRRSGLKA